MARYSVPGPRRSKLPLLLTVVGGLLMIVFFANFRAPSRADPCPEVAPKADGYLDYWGSAGVVASYGGDEVIVDEVGWASVKFNVKVTIALAGFCKAFPNGRGYLAVRGSHDGKIKASVSDGQYFD